MHEIGLAQGVLDVALEASEGARVSQIRVRVGDLHAVDRESFAFAFELVAEDTPASGAVLEIEPVAVRLTCSSCGRETVGAADGGLCPDCGSADVALVGGNELTVLGIQLADGSWRFADAGPAQPAEVH